MKRTAAIMLVIVLFFISSIQVFAVDIKPRPSLRSKVDAALEKFNAQAPNGYDYVAVISDGTYIYLFYSKTPSINQLDKVYFVSDRASQGWEISYYARIVSGTVEVNGYAIYRVDFYVMDRSTAIINGLDTLFEQSTSSTDCFVTVDDAIDLSRLQALISQADQKQESDYTAASWATLQSALSDAKVLIAGTNTQAAVDAMSDRLQAALDGLEVKPPPNPDATELKELLAEAKRLYKDDYTVSSWMDLQDAINQGDALLSQPTYTAQAVAAATEDMRSALDGLVNAKPPSTEPTGPTSPSNPSNPGWESDVNENIKTGNVSEMIKPFIDIFLPNALVILPQLIGLFGIMLGIKMIPKVLKKLLKR